MPKEYWIRVGSDTLGPFSGEQLKQLAANGELKQQHEISADQERWTKAGSVKGLAFSGPPGIDGANPRPPNFSGTLSEQPTTAEDAVEPTAGGVVDERQGVQVDSRSSLPRVAAAPSVTQRIEQQRKRSRRVYALSAVAALLLGTVLTGGYLAMQQPWKNTAEAPAESQSVAENKASGNGEMSDSRAVEFTARRLNENAEFLLGEVTWSDSIITVSRGLAGTLSMLSEETRKHTPNHEFLSVSIPMSGRSELRLDEGFRLRDQQDEMYTPIACGLTRQHYFAFDYPVALEEIDGAGDSIFATCENGRLESLAIGKKPDTFYLLFEVRSESESFHLSAGKKEFELSLGDERWFLDAIRTKPVGRIIESGS